MNRAKSVFTRRKGPKNPLSNKMFGFAAASASLAAFGTAYGQQVIIEDTFTSGSRYGTKLGEQTGNCIGLAPDTVNLPNTNWQHITGAWYDAYVVSTDGTSVTANAACFHNNAASGISLSGYNTGSLTVSAQVLYSGTPVGISGNVLAGFSSKLNTASNYGPATQAYFTGLEITGTAGALQEYVNGATVGSHVLFTGSYSAYTPTTLSYTINTVTGAISGVSFGDSTTNYNNYFGAPSSWSNSDTANVEIGGYAGGNTADFLGFELDAVPEPGIFGLFAGGALALGAFSYCRRKRFEL